MYLPGRRSLARALFCLTTLVVIAAFCSAKALSAPCERCDLLIGVGTTFRTWAWTDGFILSVALELDESRWELGAFRFTTAQRAPTYALPASSDAANPYWGFTAMRRWQVLHRKWGKLYLGLGANYRSETDYLESTRWNFAYLIAVRFDLDAHDKALELGVRHWSDAWIRPPNRGQNFLTLSLAF